MEENIKNVVDWIKTEVSYARREKVVIGISGGIDSAVSAALAVRALGKENVIGIILPCTSSPASENDAMTLINHLGIKHYKTDLESAFVAMLKGIDGPINAKTPKLSTILGNVKARLRMTTLYSYATAFNALVLGTTNKTEYLIGYYTKYGDGGVDLEPIQQFYKGEVREMARTLGIPEILITKAPTADLGITKTDEDEFSQIVGAPMTYEILDKILIALETGEELDKSIQPSVINKVLEMMKNSEHKRILPNFFERDI